MGPKRLAVLIVAVVLLVVIVASQVGYLAPEVGLLAAGAAIVGFLAMSWLGARARKDDSKGDQRPSWWLRRGRADDGLIVAIVCPAIVLGVVVGVGAIVKGVWHLGLLMLAGSLVLGLAVLWWAKNTR